MHEKNSRSSGEGNVLGTSGPLVFPRNPKTKTSTAACAPQPHDVADAEGAGACSNLDSISVKLRKHMTDPLVGSGKDQVIQGTPR